MFASNTYPDFGQNNVFETMRAYGGFIFEKEMHIRRFLCGCKSSGIKLKFSFEEVSEKLDLLLLKSGIREAYIRMFVCSDGDLDVVVKSVRTYPSDFYNEGVNLVTTSVKRHSIGSQISLVKSANYLNGVVGYCDSLALENVAGQIFDIIFLNHNGYVAETGISNIFFVKNNVLNTPSESSSILCGITRAVVMKIALDNNFTVRESIFTRHDLYNADEVFITNSIIEIMPVKSVDSRTISCGRLGEVTKKIIFEYKNLVNRRCF